MHTPGPWAAQPRESDDGDIWIRETVQRGRHAHFVRISGHWPEAESNARLIAAAPDLLEAAQAGALYSNALEAYQRRGIRGQMVDSDELDRLFQDWHDKTHAALTKVGR